MAKQKKTVRRVPQGATPRTFGNGKSSNAAQVEPAEIATPRPSGAPGVTVRTTAPGFRRRASSGTETRPQLPLAQEYHYVVGDLSRLGIVAGSMIVVMVVLGLILH
jgi:hypothetical protein